MTEQVKRVYVIGLDGMMFPMYERFAAEGLLPNLKKLADAGIVGEAYPSMPVWTPQTGLPSLRARTPARTASRAGFSTCPRPGTRSRPCPPSSARRQRLKNVLRSGRESRAQERRNPLSGGITEPIAARPRHRRVSAIPPTALHRFEVTPAWGYTNLENVTNSTQIGLQTARASVTATGSAPASLLNAAHQPPLDDGTWQNLPESTAGSMPPLEFPIEIITKRDGENQTLWGLVLDTAGKGYDTVAIHAARDGQTELGRTHVGSWSDWIYRTFYGRRSGTASGLSLQSRRARSRRESSPALSLPSDARG